MTNNYDWRYENSIGSTKDYQQVEGPVEFPYSPWRTNSVFSNYIDTIIYANQMNLNNVLDSKLQYDYLFFSILKIGRAHV